MIGALKLIFDQDPTPSCDVFRKDVCAKCVDWLFNRFELQSHPNSISKQG